MIIDNKDKTINTSRRGSGGNTIKPTTDIDLQQNSQQNYRKIVNKSIISLTFDQQQDSSQISSPHDINISQTNDQQQYSQRMNQQRKKISNNKFQHINQQNFAINFNNTSQLSKHSNNNKNKEITYFSQQRGQQQQINSSDKQNKQVIMSHQNQDNIFSNDIQMNQTEQMTLNQNINNNNKTNMNMSGGFSLGSFSKMMTMQQQTHQQNQSNLINNQYESTQLQSGDKSVQNHMSFNRQNLFSNETYRQKYGFNNQSSKVASASPKKRIMKLHEMLSMNQISSQNKYTSASTTRPQNVFNQTQMLNQQQQQQQQYGCLIQNQSNIDRQSIVSFSNMTPFSGQGQQVQLPENINNNQNKFNQTAQNFKGMFSNGFQSTQQQVQGFSSQFTMKEKQQQQNDNDQISQKHKTDLRLPSAITQSKNQNQQESNDQQQNIFRLNSLTSSHQQQQQQQKQQQVVQYQALRSNRMKVPQSFIAYLEERDDKGYLLNTTSPMQEMIEKVKEQRLKNGNVKWTTEKNLRQTRKNAISKIHKSLKLSSQTSYTINTLTAHKNISTAENSVDILTRRSQLQNSLRQTTGINTNQTSYLNTIIDPNIKQQQQITSEFIQSRDNSPEIQETQNLNAMQRTKQLMNETMQTPNLQGKVQQNLYENVEQQQLVSNDNTERQQQNQQIQEGNIVQEYDIIQQEILQLEEIIKQNQLQNLDQGRHNNYDHFKLNLIPGQQNTCRGKLVKQNTQQDKFNNNDTFLAPINLNITTQLPKQSPRSLLGMKEVSPLDIARVYLKECKNQQIKYKIQSYENSEAFQIRKIPAHELENEISQEYKNVIALNKGNQVFSAFSPTQRFTKPKFNYNADNIDFSMLDVHNKLFTSKNQQAFFNKQTARLNIFLSPDQVKIMDEYNQRLQSKLQKLQQFREMVKDNEKKYAVNKSWQVTFNYDEHRNVKMLKPFMKEMVRQIRSHTEDAKLSHFDVTALRSIGKVGNHQEHINQNHAHNKHSSNDVTSSLTSN